MKTRADVSAWIAAHYSAKFNGAVNCAYDETKRAYCIHGGSLPACPEMAHMYPRGWTLLDYIPPAKAQAMAAGITAPMSTCFAPNVPRAQ